MSALNFNTGKTKKVKRICDLLVEQYGDVVVERDIPPIDELVYTILSQNTTGINTERAYERLKARYASWNDVLNAPVEELADVIRTSGAFRVKAKRIKATLSEIQERVGKLDLSLLKDMELEEAKSWLSSLYGVGPKTAAIVLLFSFGRPVLPVDTHVWRVTKRLGLIPPRISREKAQPLLEELLPPGCVYSLNHNLVKHGREVCIARNPRCNGCFLKKYCEYFAQKAVKSSN
jgi:endonuclease-3